MENPGNQSGESAGPVEDPPPPAPAQDQSTSDSSSQQPPERRPQPPLSPLTGCYLLIIVGEPHSERHKEIILQKIAKAFLSWDVGECHVSLEKELQVITSQSPEGEEARFGERLIQYATENLVTEILIHPQLNTLHQCLKNLLSSFTKHRHIIHAGYTFAGNGSWILQDGTLSISDLVEALHETEVLRVLKAYENSVSVDIHCAAEGDWTTERFQREPVSKLCSIRINPSDVMTAGNLAISAFIDYLSPFLEPANIQQLLQPTDVVGNIRFTHPTLYVFPGGQGDAALFGINGFNMLIDGGFARKACFWDFARHLDRLDAVLLTRLNNSTINGISAVLQRKKMNHVYPQIGHFFCNLQDRKIALSPDGDKDKDSLIVNLAEEGQEIVANLRHLALKPHPCYRDGNQVDPVNLYHKVGHGKLDMYVISPARDSQAVKEFLAKWSSNDSHLFSNTGRKAPGKAFEFPLQNLVSICALLVWQPANPSDTITRILFPGSTPQHKIFEGLEKLRHLEFLKHPVCSAKSISPSASTVTVTRSVSKTRQVKPADNKLKETKVISKPQPKTVKAKTPPKDLKTKLDTNKLADEKNELENGVEETLKKLDNRILSKDEQIESIKKEIQIIEQAENEEQKKKIVHRSKYDMRNVKSKVDSRAPSKSIDRKKAPEKKAEGDTSPPTTPKKGLMNGSATKAEKAKVITKTTKAMSPSSTPAKSAKEANNRKVVEARVTSRSSSRSVTRKKEETPPPPSTTAKTERKPISRRPKAPPSPVKTLAGRSAKAEPETLPKKVKKKAEVGLADVTALGQKMVGLEKGAEIEKTELGGGVKIEMKKLETETTENKETDEKAVKDHLGSAQGKEGEEEEEDEEYLIVTKEESTEESVNDKENEEEAQTEGEGEMKKLLREEEESEKRRESRGHDEPEEEEEKVEVTERTEDKEEGDKVEERKVDEEKGVDSPEQKTPEGRESETQRLMDVDEGIDLKEPASKDHKEGESLPEEKISNTLETSATTAPTLPEDERIEEPMPEQEDEIEQPEEVQEVVEEKYIQEETKEDKPQEEEAEPLQSNVPTTIDIEGSPVPLLKKHPRDVVKTPDEVADLPVHEEVDPRMYSSGEFSKDLQKKTEEVNTPDEKKPDFKAMIKGEANFLDEDEPDSKKEPDQVRDEITSKYLNIIDELEKSATESKKEEKEEPIDAEKESNKERIPEERESKTDGVSMPIEQVKADDDLESPIPFSGETADMGKVSGKSTPLDAEQEKVTRELSEKTSPIDQEMRRKSSEEPEKESSKQPLPQEEAGDNAGMSSPGDLQKEVSRGPTPQQMPEDISLPINIKTDISGKTSPVEATKEISGKSTPEDIGNELNQKLIPQDLGEGISKESGQRDFEGDVSGKSTPLDLLSGKSTPLAFRKDTSGKSTPLELGKNALGRSSPGEPETKSSGKSTPLDAQPLNQELSGKLSSVEVEEVSGKITPHDFNKEVSGEPVTLELDNYASGRSTPQDLAKELSDKSTLLGLKTDTSGKSTPQDPEKEISRKSSPAGVEEKISGKSTPIEVEKETSRKSTPVHPEKKSSGKSTPRELEVETSVTPDLGDDISERSHQEVEKGMYRKSSHDSDREITGRSTPPDIEKDFSGKSTPHELGIKLSGKSTPQDLEKEISRKSTPVEVEEKLSRKATPVEVQEKISGKSTPQDLEKEISRKSTPVEVEEKLSRKATPVEVQEKISGKSTPQDPEKEISRKSTPVEVQEKISGKSTPQDPEKEISRKSTPVEVQEKISGKSTPVEVQEKISGKSTPVAIEKETVEKSSPVGTEEANLGKSTPRENVSRKSTPIHFETEMSGKSTPNDLEKNVSGKSTPQEIGDISRKSTPLEMEIMGKSTPSDLRQEIHRKSIPDQVEKDNSGKSTPFVAEKEISGKSTPVDVDKEIHIESPRQDQSAETFPPSTSENLEKEESAPYNVEKVASEKTSPTHSEKDKICEPAGTGEKSSGNSTPVREPNRRTSRDIPERPILQDENKEPAGVEVTDKTTDSGSAVSFPGSDSEKEQTKQPPEKEGADSPEKIPQSDKESKKAAAAVESSVSDSVSSGPGEKDVSGKSTPFSTDKETSGKTSPPGGTKVTSDSFSLALAEKGTSGTYSLEKEISEKTSSPSPVDISPLSLDEIKDLRDEGTKQKGELPEIAKSPVPMPHLEKVKREGGESSGTSTPDRSHREKSESSLANGVESEEELEKGTLESERQEKESQILDLSSGEEEELKALGVEEEEEEDVDSEPEVRKNDLEGGNITLATEIGKGKKEDINNLVKIGREGVAEEEQDSEKKSGVRRMLVTASSEDGGTETEICLQGGAKVVNEQAPKEEVEVEGEFSNLILQARKEYNNQRSRKTSCNSSDEVEEAEEVESVAGEEGEEELSALLMQARKELAFVRSKSREMKEETAEKVYETSKTTTRSETTRMDDNYLITITTILTEEREEQEDGSIKVTTTKETTTTGGKDEETVVTISTNFERKAEEKEEESSSQVNSSGEGKRGGSREDGEARTSQEEVVETSRRTSASSIISQEDLVSRKDSAKIEDFRQSSTEMSPLKTTYITSHGDSEALMTSSFYGNLPTEDEMIGREFRKGRGYESFTEIGANGERTERTYFYGGEDEGAKGGKDKSRCVKAYYTEEAQQKDGEQPRFVHRYYVPDIPEEEATVERTRFVQRFYTEEASQPESADKFRFVESMPGEPSGHLDFAKAVDEHISARGECLARELQQDLAKHTNGKPKPETEGGENRSSPKKGEEEKKKDVIGDWGKPLGLPLPPKGANRTYAFPGQNISTTSSLSTPTDNSDSVSNWGQPMSLPSPAPPATQNGTVETLPGKPANKDTPKKEKRVPPKKSISGDNRSSGNNTPNRRSESPVKQVERRTPSTGRTTKPVSNAHVYLDLTYVPHHGNSYYSNVEFFKKVRARYYVFSGTEPSKEVYNALLEAKQTWEDKKLEVTIIPTYDTDVLGYWVAENEEILAKHKIDLSPSASRCTINLQDHETSCSAYRLEF